MCFHYLIFSLNNVFCIWPQVLHETYTNTGRLMGGAEMVQHFLNRSFSLPTGDVNINQEGERSCDVSFDLFNATSGDYVVGI